MTDAEIAVMFRRAAYALDALGSGGGDGVPAGEVDPYGAWAECPAAYRGIIGLLFPGALRFQAAAVAREESGFNPLAHNTNGEDSRGLFQINVGPGGNTDMAGLSLFDPEVNVRAARKVYDYYGDWRLWWNSAAKLNLPRGS